MGQKGAWRRSRDLLFKFWDPLISLELVKVQTSNFARGLKVRDLILNKKCKTGHAKLVKTGDDLHHMQHLGPVTF